MRLAASVEWRVASSTPESIKIECGRRSPSFVKTLFVAVAFCLLLFACWPLALLVVILWPLLWLLSLPFRLVSVTFDALIALLKAILFLPARILGYRDRPIGRAH